MPYCSTGRRRVFLQCESVGVSPGDVVDEMPCHTRYICGVFCHSECSCVGSTVKLWGKFFRILCTREVSFFSFSWYL